MEGLLEDTICCQCCRLMNTVPLVDGSVKAKNYTTYFEQKRYHTKPKSHDGAVCQIGSALSSGSVRLCFYSSRRNLSHFCFALNPKMRGKTICLGLEKKRPIAVGESTIFN